MINLLPKDEKRQIYAGRSNLLLVRYNLLMSAVIVVIVLVMGGVYFYLTTTKISAEQRLAETQSSSQQLAKEKKQIEAFRTNLATAKQILDKRVDYSKVILRVSNIIPDGVVLGQLSLDPAQFGAPTKMNIKARSETAVLEFKNTLNSSKYFSDAYIDTITRGEGEYPYTATLTVTFSKELIQ